MSHNKPSFLTYISLAFEMIVTITGLTFLGRWLDGKWNQRFPWFTLLGVFSGLALSFYRIFKSLNRNT